MMLMVLLTALLGNYFSQLNLKYEIYIPDRKTEVMDHQSKFSRINQKK